MSTTIGQRLTVDQREALEQFLARNWGGQGGPQTAIRKLKETFGIEIAHAGWGQRLSGTTAHSNHNGTAEEQTMAKRTQNTGTGNLAVRIQNVIDQRVAQGVAETINRLFGDILTPTDTALRLPADDSQDVDDEPTKPRKRRKSIRRSRAMKAAWAARKQAAATNKASRKR